MLRDDFKKVYLFYWETVRTSFSSHWNTAHRPCGRSVTSEWNSLKYFICFDQKKIELLHRSSITQQSINLFQKCWSFNSIVNVRRIFARGHPINTQRFSHFYQTSWSLRFGLIVEKHDWKKSCLWGRVGTKIYFVSFPPFINWQLFALV